MNYIKNLQAKLQDCECGVIDADRHLTDLVVYLTSPKFHVDTTVQVADVLRRLEGIRSAVGQLKDNL